MRRYHLAVSVLSGLIGAVLLWLSRPAWPIAFPVQFGHDCDKAAFDCVNADQRKALMLIAFGCATAACWCVWNAVTLVRRDRLGPFRPLALAFCIGLATAMAIVAPIEHLDHIDEWLGQTPDVPPDFWRGTMVAALLIYAALAYAACRFTLQPSRAAVEVDEEGGRRWDPAAGQGPSGSSGP